MATGWQRVVKLIPNRRSSRFSARKRKKSQSSDRSLLNSRNSSSTFAVNMSTVFERTILSNYNVGTSKSKSRLVRLFCNQVLDAEQQKLDFPRGKSRTALRDSFVQTGSNNNKNWNRKRIKKEEKKREITGRTRRRREEEETKRRDNKDKNSLKS